MYENELIITSIFFKEDRCLAVDSVMNNIRNSNLIRIKEDQTLDLNFHKEMGSFVKDKIIFDKVKTIFFDYEDIFNFESEQLLKIEKLYKDLTFVGTFPKSKVRKELLNAVFLAKDLKKQIDIYISFPEGSPLVHSCLIKENIESRENILFVYQNISNDGLKKIQEQIINNPKFRLRLLFD